MRIPPVIALLVLAAGCGADRDDAVDTGMARDKPAADTAAAPPATPPAAGPDVAMRYACDANTYVVVLHDGGARVSLPEDRDVDLSRIAGSQPPIYTGSSLYFTIGDDRAHLSQGDETNELACSPL